MDTGIAGLASFLSVHSMLVFQVDTPGRAYSGTDSTADTLISHLKSYPDRLRRIMNHPGIHFMRRFFCKTRLLYSSLFCLYGCPDFIKMLFHLLIHRHLFLHIKCRKEIIHHLDGRDIVGLFPRIPDEPAGDLCRSPMMCAVSQHDKQIVCFKGSPADKIFHHSRHFMPINRTYDTDTVRSKFRFFLFYELWNADDIFIQFFCHIQAVSGSRKVKDHFYNHVLSLPAIFCIHCISDFPVCTMPILQSRFHIMKSESLPFLFILL